MTKKKPVYKLRQFRRAGPTDLIELPAPPGGNPLFLVKATVETLVSAIIHGDFIHLSGPTGTAKTSLIEALYKVPKSFETITKKLGFPVKPIKLFPVEMVTFETPGELYERRSLKEGCTFDEESRLVSALRKASKASKDSYAVVWLREIGRTHTSSVQGGLLNLMTKGDIVLANGTRLDGSKISWLADSNYQAEHDSTHTLVTFDDALRRRFSINLTLDYLQPEQEVLALQLLNDTERIEHNGFDLIRGAVELGQNIRRHRTDGNLTSATPPTISGYLAFIRTARALPHHSIQQIAKGTLLGNVSQEDKKQADTVLSEVFTLDAANEGKPGVAAI